MKPAEEYYRRKERMKPDEHLYLDDLHIIDMLEEYASQNTLNRDKVMDIFAKFEGEALAHRQHGKETFPVAEKYTDAICSLSLPTLSEEDKKKLADKYSRNLVGDDNAGSTAYLNHYAVFLAALDAAIKELINNKEE